MDIRPNAEWLRRAWGDGRGAQGGRGKSKPVSARAAVQRDVRTALTTLLRPPQPDRPWCAPEPLPPDARHTAQGKTTLSCFRFRGLFGGCVLGIRSFVLGDDLPESRVAYTTLVCRTWGYAALFRKKKKKTFRRQRGTSLILAPVPTPVSESASLLGAEMRTSGGAVSSPRTPRLCGSPKARDTSAIPGRVCYPDVLKEVTGRQTEGPKVSELVPQ